MRDEGLVGEQQDHQALVAALLAQCRHQVLMIMIAAGRSQDCVESVSP